MDLSLVPGAVPLRAYAGTMICDALPAMRALKTAVTMTVAPSRPWALVR